ncbi:glyoxylate/hydroxypyruvate reductase A [Paracoccus onubensis]|uniref:2-hydroxyacid dehydrogenase n=1 Tax=Paracoccus onubensis TaxID=1675788 RepID=UPI002732047C|nr:glyoxylate/hydroxypyruvate reductase A [Paracoccus onubensis]MDP0927176.1 glyoxylate/hydroxypyruvate reductase A [Paracoccus onubensis]
MTLLYLSTAERAAIWSPIFVEAGERMVIGEDAVADPADITHIACWIAPEDLSRYPNLQAVIGVGAGIDQMPPMPDGVALSRTIAPGIAEMVRDWVMMAALMLHREMPRYLEQARQGEWHSHPARPTRRCRIGVMGLGQVGRLVAQNLSALGFPVAGWSRSGNPVGGLEVYGAAALDDFLARTEMLICLLPLTEATRGLLNARLLAKLPGGAGLIHAGRGAQLEMDALRDALDSGQIGAAMLDVTDPEPLPPEHWAWRHPEVIVTPHIASYTDAEEGARHALSVIRASRAGQPIPGLVDQNRGY